MLIRQSTINLSPILSIFSITHNIKREKEILCDIHVNYIMIIYFWTFEALIFSA